MYEFLRSLFEERDLSYLFVGVLDLLDDRGVLSLSYLDGVRPLDCDLSLYCLSLE